MSEAEILAELPMLKAEERAEVFRRLCELQEQELLQGAGPSEGERDILDQALSEFQHDSSPGVPWRQALREIRSSKRP